MCLVYLMYVYLEHMHITHNKHIKHINNVCMFSVSNVYLEHRRTSTPPPVQLPVESRDSKRR